MSKEEKIVGQCKSSVSKELEALERVDDYVDKDYDYCQRGDYRKDYKLIKQALQRLESIVNASPSEALECLKEMAKYRIEYSEYSMPIKDISEYKTINKALLKSQEQEKENKTLKACISDWEDNYEHLQFALYKERAILKIIKEKYVDIYLLKSINTLEGYNKNIGLRGIELTQEEYELLKRWLG